MAYLILSSLTLPAFWLLLSGFWDHGLLLAFGALSVVIAAGFGLRMERLEPTCYRPAMLLRIPAYWVWLTGEIVKANIDVVKRIWWPQEHPISPTMQRLHCTQQTLLGKTIYANSITLTPGTVAIEVSDNEILVHALSGAALQDLATGDMDRRVTRLEGAR
ncbi:cation transporter [Thiohalocapsa marina]|uniref:Cation transporter n=1 Tax=Thiohalocapsa marina TaxID=424902 RepID=A0A5M8FV45_9GAMM|nr:Na+/H+ antiporter subunit E [Thiohalocapsa marina]KAA6187680.1 cation transporter [Thiohalocapsa marina]